MRFFQRPSFGDQGYDPNQPRVPAGNPDGGQWTSTGGSGDLVEFSAAKRRRPPRPVPEGWPPDMWQTFEAHRLKKLLNDLFGEKRGVVARTEINGEEVFGENRRSGTFSSEDNIAVRRLRATLVEKYPGVMQRQNLGFIPNDALFHAETTVLLRAARKNGGTLAGQTLEVFVEKAPCPSCKKVLPYVGLELGNPTVIFIPTEGKRITMRDGAWVE
jgi:hypothetical protein